jgi:integrase
MPGKSKGKHPDKKLSATRVRALREPGRYVDGNGLYLVVDPSGAKRWLLRTVVHGKRRDIGLGGLSVVSLAAAREEAARFRGIARKDDDPLIERNRERQVVPTFAEAAQQLHASLSPTFRNVKHRQQWINTLIQHANTLFGDRQVNHIGSEDVLKALNPIWLKTPETASRVRQRIRAVFDWCKASGFRSGDNPVDGLARVLPKQPTSRRHFAALPYRDVPAFITALQDTGAGTSVKLAFELMILTATRTSEVLMARWTEVDLRSKTWTIPADRMKANRDHRVPLSARCIQILREAKSVADGGPFVFPGRSPERSLSNMCFHMALRRMEWTNCTPHGFRSSFRDWAAERTNFPRQVCEAALAHLLPNKTEAAYNRTTLFDRRRELMDSWASFTTQSGGSVVNITTARRSG